MIFQTQTQRKNIFDEFTKKLRERAAMDPMTRKDGNLNYLFLVYDRDKEEVSHYSVYTTNHNYPELIEMLIWEHLLDIVDHDPTNEEICAHYNWILNEVSKYGAEKRIGGRANEVEYLKKDE